MTRTALLFCLSFVPASVLHACDCALELPHTFCDTMDPAWYFPPDVVVLGVKMEEEAHGMHVRVLQVFQGDAEVDDTLMVWGDNGACCRWFVNTWADGDTVIWAFNETDFMGNLITPQQPDLEEPGDYCIDICGVYWLGYSGGIVSTEANGVFSGDWIVPGVTSLPIEEFWSTVAGCSSVGIGTPEPMEGLSVRMTTEGVWLVLPVQESIMLQVTDAAGRAVLRRRWNGEPVWVGGLATGVFTVSMESAGRLTVRKLYIP